MTLSPGDQFGPYRLEERLGAGGLAEVWRAVEISSGRVVALKRFSGALASADAERLRADVELLAANALGGNPHVVAVYGGGPTPEPHVVMEYMDGGDLSDELAQGKLTLARTLEVGQAVASALAAAAEAGIVHGDLKPSNILLGSDGAIKLSDFNVARVVGYTGASVSGTLLLSFAYAAPEVWDGKPSSASDIYALGCVLYECLSGVQPFTGSYTEVFKGHINKTPDLDRLPADTPPELRTLLAEMLAKEAKPRPSAADVVGSLTAIRSDIEAHAGEQLPSSIGPWHVESVHPAQPLAWRARDDKSGEIATLELLLGDKELGEHLRAAVAVNDQLVPLGAERLLGTNRLLLRPGEGLGRAIPKGSWIFWVAREELPLPPPAGQLDATTLAKVATNTKKILAAATSAGIALDLSPANLLVLPDGSIHVRRPGLPGPGASDPEQSALATLKGLAAPGVLSAIAGADTLTELQSLLARGSASTELHEQPAATAELPRFEPTVRLQKQRTPALHVDDGSGRSGGHYSALASTATPASIIYVLDVSSTMTKLLDGKRRIEVVNSALQAAVKRMVSRSTKGRHIAPRYRVAIIAYSDRAYDLLDGFQNIDRLARVGVPTFTPNGPTNTAAALEHAATLLERNLKAANGGPAPLVCHMTDGTFTGDDPLPVARRIMEMNVGDGAVLLENIYIDDSLATEIPVADVYRWEGVRPRTSLSSRYARTLRDMSSALPDSYRAVLAADGFHLAKDAVMMLPGFYPALVSLGFQMSASTPVSRL